MKDAAPVFVLGSFVAACCVKVDRLPVAGESLRASTFILEAGGKGFNCAVGLRRLGVDVDGQLAIGDDWLSHFAEHAVMGADLPERMLARCAGQTGAGVGFIEDGGQNCIAVYPGANDRLSSDHVIAVRLRLERARLVIAQFEIGDDSIAAAFALARAAGATTILNPSPFRSIPESIVRAADIVIVNEVEAQGLAAQLGAAADAAWSDLAYRLFARGPRCLVVTAGSRGAWAWSRGGEPVHQPAFAVTAIDSMGAGDAFLAGFAATLQAGGSLQDGLRQGAACGALVASRLGVLAALPDRAEVQAFLTA